MQSVVRPRASSRRLCWISRSVAESSADVASSRTRIGGFFSTVRANRHALLLAPRELQPTLTHHGLVPVGGGDDEIVDAGEPRRALDLGRRRARPP